MAKRRKHSEDYLNIDFTTVLADNGVEKPQCVLCDVVLSAESMKPSELKRHLETKHLEHAEKDLEFFKLHELLNFGNIDMFEKLCGVMYESEGELDQFLKEEIAGHLESLEKEFQRYFPELTGEEEALVRNPFSATLDVSSIPDEVQDEFLDLRNDSP
ncbi:Zinc finger BED domain-containing protein 5-like 6, partial [Homarus americanus]